MKNFLNRFYFIFIFIVSIVNAQWPTTVDENLIINNHANYPFSVLSDSNGGAYLVFGKNGYTSADIPFNILYLLHIDKFGYQVGSEIQLTDNEDARGDAKLIRASDGNLILGMADRIFLSQEGSRINYFSKLVVQKFDTLGNKLWKEETYISTDDYSTEYYEYDLISDTEGGCYASFIAQDTSEIYYPIGYKSVQRISKDGERLWGENGIKINEGNLTNTHPELYHSTIDELIVTSFQNGNGEDYFMKFNSNGDLLWKIHPRLDYFTISSIEINKGGIYSVVGFSSPYRYLVEKIDNDGIFIWDEPTILVDSLVGNSEITSMYVDDDETLIILWSDLDVDNFKHSYLQQITASGNQIYGMREVETLPIDIRTSGTKFFSEYFLMFGRNLIAYKFSYDGTKLWGANGVQFSNDLDQCFIFPHYSTDNNGGCLIFWLQCLQGIRGKQINRDGKLGKVLTGISSKDEYVPTHFFVTQNYPNPFNPSTVIKYSTSRQSNLKVTLYNSLGEKVETWRYYNISPGNHSLEIHSGKLSSGIYICNFIFTNVYSTSSAIYSRNIKMILLK